MSASSCVATAVKPSPSRERLQQADVRGVDVAFARVGDLRRLEVGALDEAQVRARAGAAPPGRPRSGRGTTAGRRRRSRGRSRAGGGRCAASRRRGATPPCRCGRSCPRAARRARRARRRSRCELLVDREAEVRQLERDVRPQGLRLDAVEHLAVGGDDLARLGLVAHALAEERRVREEAAVVQPAQDGHGSVEALAGDEARGAEPEAVPLHEALQARAVRCREDEAAEEFTPASRARSARPPRARPPSAPAAARAPPARSGRRGDRAPSSMRRGTAGAGAMRGARSPCSPAPAVGSRTSGTTASGKLAASPETAPTAPAREPALEQRLGADEDVESLERGTARAAPTGCPRPSSPRGSARARAAARSSASGIA